MKKNFIQFVMTLLALFYIGPTNSFCQASGYRIIGSIEIGGAADWDYLSVFQQAHELFVSHYSEVDVIDLSTNKVIGKISGLLDVHGTAFAPEFGKGFISDGKHNSVVIFDLKNLKVIKRVKTTGNDPDAIVYNPFTKRVFAFNGNSTNASAFDAKTGERVGDVQLSGSPEFGVSDFKGRMFVNIEKKNEIDVIDPQSLKVIHTWPIPPCERPSAMAIDRENDRLFVGARNKTFAVVDANSGRVIASFPIGSGVDACRFDPQTQMIFASTKDGKLSIFRQNSPDSYSFVEAIETLPGAKTMALDEQTHLIYTSAMLNALGSSKTFGLLIIGRR